MKQFLLGFAAASALWFVALWAQSTGRLGIFEPADEVAPEERAALLEVGAGPGENDDGKRLGKKRKGKRGRQGNRVWPETGAEYETGEGMSGDELKESGALELSMGSAGGEEQLSEAEIDKGIDRVFKGIERCLVLVSSGVSASGKVIVGMRISSGGIVTEVNLKGPNALVGGEVGACIRRTVKSIRYPAFDGPDMIAHYPIAFE